MNPFDKHAEAYQTIRHKIAYPESLYAMLAAAAPARRAALDIGCGNGVSTFRLAPYFEVVEGQDVGANLIEKAVTNYPNIAFRVCPAEQLRSDRKFDLITSATSFYWMDREVVLQRVADVLSERGVFCAYKYDFPVLYGPLRKVVEHDLALYWAPHRDAKLVNYDDTLERMEASGRFDQVERFVLSNILTLTAREVALFFLSTSYVTRYIDAIGGPNYADDFLARLTEHGPEAQVRINFDIHGFKGRKRST